MDRPVAAALIHEVSNKIALLADTYGRM